MNARAIAQICDDWAVDGSFERCAEVYDLDVADVVRIVDQEAAKASTGEQLRQDIFAERLRISRVERAFLEGSLAGDKGAAEIFFKASRAFRELLGLDAPKTRRHSVAIASIPIVNDRSARAMLRQVEALTYDPLYGGTPIIDGEPSGVDGGNG